MEPIARFLPTLDYEPCWQAMRRFTDRRTADTQDELWVLEHPPVFTLGQAGKPEHLLAPGDVPVVHCDRGGQVTWHGPGQTVVYLMLDLNRLNIGSRELVSRIEQAVVSTLAGYGVEAAPRRDAPGVYVDGCKIASLGLRIRRGFSYHGLALNRDPDLDMFRRINPCGHAGQPVTSLASLGAPSDRAQVDDDLVHALQDVFDWPAVRRTDELPDCYTTSPPKQAENP